jgi:hypothetical protein
VKIFAHQTVVLHQCDCCGLEVGRNLVPFCYTDESMPARIGFEKVVKHPSIFKVKLAAGQLLEVCAGCFASLDKIAISDGEGEEVTP